jgi:putative transposase
VRPKLQERFVAPIKAMIEEHPSFGYRTVAHLLGMNKNTVQRVFQCKGWQGAQAPGGFQATHTGAALCGQGTQ